MSAPLSVPTRISKVMLLVGELSEICLDTAVNVKDLTVYEIGSGGSKEYCRTCKVFGITPSACGSLRIGYKAIKGML